MKGLVLGIIWAICFMWISSFIGYIIELSYEDWYAIPYILTGIIISVTGLFIIAAYFERGDRK